MYKYRVISISQLANIATKAVQVPKGNEMIVNENLPVSAEYVFRLVPFRRTNVSVPRMQDSALEGDDVPYTLH